MMNLSLHFYLYILSIEIGVAMLQAATCSDHLNSNLPEGNKSNVSISN